ncbi:phage integrase SAM-like domain-containing protein [Algoriphagus lutimaris]|uniref:site-specific integrase n=1 Tax=Algoriphagus lutimaris TaxID=613197 RepID=UPI00196B3C00|nr:site-specific integrase [Algoriphagus lutimaris]MBN3520708.1 phage integrase SAM-like domain-containing protein [Algoriphagus lutimaris]
MAKFNFYLRDKKKDGETPILFMISFGSIRVKYPSQKSIHPKFWNERDQQARQVREFPQAKVFNSTLKHLKDSAEKTLLQLETELERLPTSEELKNQLDIELGRSIPFEEVDEKKNWKLLDYFELFIEESKDGTRLTPKGRKFDKRSIQKYNTVLRSLREFGQTYPLTFESIDKSFYTKYVKYLNTEISEKKPNGEKKIIKKAFSINNVGKYIQVIKTFLAWATENGVNHNLYYRSRQFKAPKEPGFSIYLNEKEIEAIYYHDLSNTPHLERIRDLFIVGCWTGLRFSDFTNIQPEDIEGDFIKIKTFKTETPVVIPVHWMVRKILEKYDGKYPNSLPPATSNQNMNNGLKEIAEKVDLLKVTIYEEGVRGGVKFREKSIKWKYVVTHTARRSFATNVYLSGFPAISIMKITGHTTEKAFLAYIKVTPEENAKRLLEHWAKS